MKRKLLIALTVVLTVAFAVLVVVLSREPVQAADPSKDYSKTTKPRSQVLSDTYSQPEVKDTAPTPLATSTDTSATSSAATPSTTTDGSTTATSSPTTPASQDTQGTKSTTDDKHKTAKPPISGSVDSLLQALSNLRL